ncbi:MAG: ArdC family protein [Acidobacteriota bacterium]|nr:ArdC family protein [Acidobacteriota bacterium]
MANAKSKAPGRDRIEQYHQQFADSIIKQIEAGTAPWQKP